MTTKEQIAAMMRAPWAYGSEAISALIGELLERPKRHVLPNRRPNATIETEWRDGDRTHSFTVTVGYDEAGEVKEVFADHAKGAMAATLKDICTILSVALQHGITPEALAKSLGTVPDYVLGQPVDAPASPIGAIVGALR